MLRQAPDLVTFRALRGFPFILNMSLVKTSWSEIELTWEEYLLPQDVIDACIDIQNRVWENTNPTQICSIWVQQRNHILTPWDYLLDKESEVQYFVSLLTRWILPTCEIHKHKWEFHSLSMNHAFIHENISIPELVADLVLLHILTDSHELIDRGFYNYCEWEQENFIYRDWSLSIFDLEIEIWDLGIDTSRIGKVILQHISRISRHLWADESNKFKELVRCKNNRYLFLNRLRIKIEIFLEKYSSDDWKDFFMLILNRSWASNEYERKWITPEILYNTFIWNLEKLQQLLEKK